MKNFKSYFRLNRVRRIVILGATVLAALLAIVLGSTLYTTKSENVRKSSEYTNSASYDIRIKKNAGDKTTSTEVANEIYYRVDELGLKGMEITPYTSQNVDYLHIQYPLNQGESAENILQTITHKPALTFTDTKSQPLFNSQGTFNLSSSNTLAPVAGWDLNNLNTTLSKPAVLNSKVEVISNKNGTYKINIPVNRDVWTYLSLVLNNQTTGSGSTAQPDANANKVVGWLNLDQWINHLKNTQYNSTTSLWDNASQNPYNALYVNNDPTSNLLRDEPGYFSSLARDYRFVEFNLTTSSLRQDPVTGITYLSLEDANNAYDAGYANAIAKQIDFSNVSYDLVPVDSPANISPAYGQNAFKYFVIAMAVAFSLIALMLMVNYGLLGALSTIALALFSFITLTLFTVMRGEYSPEAISALIVCFGLALDSSIVWFERLKNEIYSGENLQLANRVASRKSFWTFIDANVVSIIIATVMFYFGTRSILGFSVTLVVAILASIVIAVIFTRMTASLLIKTGYFNTRLKWLGINQKFDSKVNATVSKGKFFQNAWWLSIVLGLFVCAGFIAFFALGGRGNYAEAFARTSDVTSSMVRDVGVAIAISLAAIIVYTMIRFRWTYVLSLLIAFAMDAFLMIAILIFAKVQISPVVLSAFLGMAVFSLNDKLVTLDRLREKIRTRGSLKEPGEIQGAAREAIDKLFKRSFLLTLTFLIGVAILTAFKGAIEWQVSFVLLVGPVFVMLTSIFTLPLIWTIFEKIRQKGIARRTSKSFWKTKGVEEQIIEGINDYSY